MLSTEQVFIGNVTFEPGCRNNWHIHHAKIGGGQILLVTAGKGWYQEWNKPARALKPGNIVNIPANVKLWHGAAADSWFAHLAVEVPGEVFKVRYTPVQIFETIINLTILLPVSGIMMSRHVFRSHNFGGISFARLTHLLIPCTASRISP